MNKISKHRMMLHCYKKEKLTLWGLKNNLIKPYDEELITKLRHIYSGAIPASILLLSNCMCNGKCYDRAYVMAQAFLDTEDDVNLIYATVDSIKLNPRYIDESDPLYADHCFVERITKDGKHLIYDTSSGYVYDKKLYWLLENPKVRHITPKEVLVDRVKNDEYNNLEDIERDKRNSIFILPLIEMSYDFPGEKYSKINGGILQREVEIFKKSINYDELQKEAEQDMKKLFLIK